MYLGEAFGHPGLESGWAVGAKEGVGTAVTPSSRVWFTLARGIVTEVYYPRVDIANTRDLQFLVTDGKNFFHEEQRDLAHRLEYVAPHALAYRLINEDPEGRYRIVKHVVTDPEADCLLLWTRFHALVGRLEDYKLYILLAPRIKNQGAGNWGAVRTVEGRNVLSAWREDIALALASSAPFTKSSCGFVGFSDGWTDLNQDFQMDWQFATASNGNIALTAEIDHVNHSEFVLALGFGTNPDEASQVATQSLLRPFEEVEKQFVQGWRDYCAGLKDLSLCSQDGGRLYYISAMVLKAHEDKTNPGAFVASLSVPWGEATWDANAGGYHLCWPRDLVHIATACIAAGDVEAAVRALRYLQKTQREDGSWPQNCWVDGRPYWSGLQMDEVALPVLLAWRLGKLGAVDASEEGAYDMVRRAALFVARCGPVTPQERWEENTGYSPGTLAAEIAGLVCASSIARDRGEEKLAAYLLEVADSWAARIEDWTFTRCGNLLPPYTEYYERIASLTVESLDQGGTECRIFLPLRNRVGEAQVSQCCLVDPSFLDLVRYGIRSPGDPHVLKTLLVVDALLRVDTPCGPAWHRYNSDGYGEHEDGAPYDGNGVGRSWPLLTGERGHYELALGHDVSPYVRALECFPNQGGMLPEQVWDSQDIPQRGLTKGRGTGSATPLAWAHAEYIRLLRSIADRRVLDRIEPVYQRYVGRPRSRGSDLVICKFNHKVRAIRADQRLRLEVHAPAELHWSADEWTTVYHEPMEELVPGVWAREFPPSFLSPGRALRFTFYWPQVGRWEGRDFIISVVPGEKHG